MSYVDRVAEVAAQAAVAQVPFQARVVELWSQVETRAKQVNYDVFAPSPALRETMRTLTSLLYEVPGASPTADAEQIAEKNRLYGESWCKRGGAGAFMMLARKADRFLETPTGDHEDTLGDLRRYLILVEAWLQEKEAPTAIEAVGATIEEAFSKSLCDRCSHHRDTHHSGDDRLLGHCQATGCFCEFFKSKDA